MNILITGGSGFVGSHLTDRLVTEGHNVTVIDNLSTGKRKWLNPNATFHEIDIKNGNDLHSVFEKNSYDIIYHLAGQISVSDSIRNPYFDALTNIVGGLNLLECARLYEVPRFIFASTGGAMYHDGVKKPAKEEYLAHPPSPYGVAKQTFERYMEFYGDISDINWTSLRLANVYGPRQDPHGEAGVIAIFISSMLNKRHPMITGDGKQTRDFIYVDDVVEAFVKAPKGKGKEIYNICSNYSATINDVYAGLVENIPQSMVEKYIPARPNETRHVMLSGGKARMELGFRANTPLKEGLSKTVKWFRGQKKN